MIRGSYIIQEYKSENERNCATGFQIRLPQSFSPGV